MIKEKHLSYEETITRVSKFCKPGKKYLCNNRSGGLFIMLVEKIQKSWNDLFKDFLVEYRKDMSEVKTDISGLKKDMSEVKTDISVLKKDMFEVKDRLTIVEHKVDAVALDLKETKIRNNLK